MKRIKQMICLVLTVVFTFTATGLLTFGYDVDANELPAEYTQISGLKESGAMIGLDVTRYQQQKNEWNKVFKDYEGAMVDYFAFLKQQGINTVSVKVAVNPTGEDQYLSLGNAIATAKEAKEKGLAVNIVLLFSDSMTYGSTQTPPDEWLEEANAAPNEINPSDVLFEKASVYVEGVLDAFSAQEAMPDILTLGNEVNYNFLGLTDYTGWNNLRRLSTDAKSYAQEEFGASVKVAYSFSAPENASDIQYIVDSTHLNDTWGVADYDYVGINLYSDWHKPEYIDALKEQYNASQTRDAKLYISKINYPYYSGTDPKIDLYSQMDHLYDLLTFASTEGGFIYNETEYDGDWNSISFFNNDGCAVPSLGVINRALNGSSDADPKIDPYCYGGEFMLKDVTAEITPIEGMTDSMIRGVDISSYEALKAAGVKFYNNDGNEASLLEALNDNGVNYIRLRVFNDPYNENGETYGGGSNDPETTLRIAKEAAEYGMKVELCLHYSDFWADPAVQILPKEWQPYANDSAALSQKIYDFTAEILREYTAEGVDIGMIQIGNEITRGAFGIRSYENPRTFWADPEKGGKVKTYLGYGIKAAREVCPDALIALHLDGTTLQNQRTVFDSFEESNLDYDVLGVSYYPFWGVASEWANTPKALIELSKHIEKKGKMLCVLETSWPTTLKDADGKAGAIGADANVSAFPLGVQGQVDELTDVYSTLVKTSNGIGAFYWEPAWIPVKPGWAYWEYNLKMANEYGTGWAAQGAEGYYDPNKLHYQDEDSWGGTTWENLALFDNNGYPLDSLRFYKDAVPESGKDVQQQVVIIHIVDEKGTSLNNDTAVRVDSGKTVQITLPKINGYKPASGTYTLSITGTDAPRASKTVTYKVDIQKGQSFTVNGSTYVVTKTATEKASGTVTLKKAKNAKSAKVPASVKLKDGKNYNVTVINAKAFTGKKIKSITLGANVTTIKAKAFKGSKATKLILKTKKLTKKKVKGSLKSSKIKKISVKVGKKSQNKKYVKKYKRFFTKKNAGKKVTVK